MKRSVSDLKKCSKLMSKPVTLTGDRRLAVNEAVLWMYNTVEKIFKAKTFTKKDALALSYCYTPLRNSNIYSTV